MTAATDFIARITAASFPRAFNPYRDRCVVHDRHDAPELRRDALLRCLEAAQSGGVDSLWIARDLGYRGGRRTGLALTDDVHLAKHAARWSVTINRATKGSLVAERTAVTTWGLLDRIEDRIFLWNVFPLHPHEEDDELTNRRHTAVEREFGMEMLDSLVRLLQPRRLVCIGNDAANATRRLAVGPSAATVRHPSYGGTAIFTKQICELYGLDERPPQLRLL